MPLDVVLEEDLVALPSAGIAAAADAVDIEEDNQDDYDYQVPKRC